MEEVFKSSPELLEVLKEEKEFEDMMNTRTSDKHRESPEDKLIPQPEKKIRSQQNKCLIKIIQVS